MKVLLLSAQAGRLLRMPRVLFLLIVSFAPLAVSGSETEYGEVGVLTKFPPSIHGRVEGVVQFTQGRTFVLSNGGEIDGSLLVPGSPWIRRNRGCAYFDLIEGSGSPEPSNYKLIFNRGASVDTVVTRVDPVPLSEPVAPSPPEGYRTVVLSESSDPQDLGDFATLKHLKLKTHAGYHEIPAGAYGYFAAAQGSGIVLGNPGDTEPAVYHFQKLRFGWGSQLKIAGPVVVNVAEGFASGGILGNTEHPELLTMNIKWGGLNIVHGGCFYGNLKTPMGHVNVNHGGILVGSVEARRLHVHRHGLLVASLCVTPTPGGNEVPIADSQTLETNEDTPVSLVLSASDPDGDPLSYSIVDAPTKGVLTGVAPILEYTPNTDETGTDFFTFVASDGSLESPPALVDLTIHPVNDAPVAAGQTVEVLEDVATDIDLKGSDVENDPLTFSIMDQPVHGTLDVAALPRVVYYPDPDSENDDSFTFIVNDGALDSSPATVVISLTPINDAPGATPQTVELLEDQSVEITLAGTDEEGDTLSYEIVTPPEHGSLELVDAQDPIVDPVFEYAPELNYHSTDFFTYRVFDGALYSEPAAVQLEIEPVNDSPLAETGSFTLTEDTIGTLLLTGSDVDGDELEFIVQTPPSQGEILSSGEAVTSFPHSLGLSNAVDYRPFSNSNQPDVFTFQVSDGQVLSPAATAQIVIVPENDQPEGVPQSLSTLEDTGFGITLTASDPEGDPLTYEVTNPPASGTLEGVAPDLTYLPSQDFNGIDTFAFVANDGEFDSEPVIVEIEVQPVNDAPIADPGEISVLEDGSALVAFSASDIESDPEDLSFQIESLPPSGTLELNGAALSSAGVAVLSTDSLIYQPDADFAGTDAFTYAAFDGEDVSNVETVYLNVTPVNDPPEVAPQSVELLEDESVSVQLEGSDVDGDALTFEVVSGPAAGSLTGELPEIVYSPLSNVNGTDRIEYRAFDGELYSETEEFEFVVLPVNDAPVIAPAQYETQEDVPLVGSINVVDIDSPGVTLAIINGPARGSLALNGLEFVYTPETNQTEGVTFDVQANDGDLNSNIATLSIAISAINDPPFAEAANLSTPEDSVLNGQLLASDAEGDPLSFALETPPAFGTVSIDGSGAFTYSPNADYHGPDLFTYTVSDGNETVSSGIVLTVEPVNDAPTVSPLYLSVAENESVSLALSGMDVDGDFLTFTIATGPSSGTLYRDGMAIESYPALLSSGILVYTPLGSSGSADSFSFYASDGQIESALETVEFLVGDAVNQAPVVDAGPDQTLFARSITDLSNAHGILIVCSDEWYLSNEGYALSTSTANFTRNLLGLFADAPGAQFLAYCTPNYRGFAESQFEATVFEEGHSLVVDNSQVLTLEYLSQFDAVFVDATFSPNKEALGQYIDQGGNVFITAASALIDPADEADFWNPFLANYGMTYASVWNGIQTLLPLDTGNPLSEGVTDLHYYNGASITLTNPLDLRLTVIQSYDDEYLMVARTNGVEVESLLEGTVTDDGLPVGSELTSQWTVVDGPGGEAVLSDPASPISAIGFTTPGSYTLRLQASDGELSSEDEANVLVVRNDPPIVYAGPNGFATGIDSVVNLDGFVFDDGFPVGTLETEWSVFSGPGAVAFSEPESAATTAQFALPGIYVLNLSADDSLERSDDRVEFRIGPLAASPLPDGIAAWWSFNGTLAESVLGDSILETNTDPVFTSGAVATALSFDGENDELCTPGSDQLDLGASASGLTVEFWMNPSEFRDAVLTEWNDGAIRGVSLRQWWFGKGLYGFLMDSEGNEHVISTDDILELNTWQHVALTYNREEGVARLYRNAVLLRELELGVFAPRTDLDFCLGSSRTEGYRFKGALDEVSLYDRPLSFEEIQSIYLAADVGKSPVSNRAPMVDGGPDRVLADTSLTLSLNATASDEDGPLGELDISWTQVDGPGTVVFSSPGELSSTAQFSDSGIYLLEVLADDGLLEATGRVEVRVGLTAIESPPGLEAWWPLNGDPLERLAGVHNFSLQGGADYTAAQVSLGLELDGTSGLALTESGSGLDIGASPQGLTVEMWVKPSSYRDAPLAEWTSGGSYGLSLRQWWFGQGLYGFFKDESGAERVVSANGVMELGVWQHVALTYDRESGIARIYRNALEVASADLGTFRPQTDSDFVVGGSFSESRYFDGSLDEVALYNRALSAAELGELYQAGATGRAPVGEKAPIVWAGTDRSLDDVATSLDLLATVDDDGPLESIEILWTVKDGPGIVGFTNPDQLATTVTFDSPGIYVLEVAAHDGLLRSADSSTVRVDAPGAASPSGLAAWWPLNGDPREAIEGVHHFALEGGSDYAVGQVSLGLELDGSTGRALASAGTGLDVGASPDGLTVEMWVNPSEFRDAPLVEWASNGAYGVSLRQWWFGQGLYGFLRDSSGVEHVISVNGVMELGTWQHVALTYDAQSGFARLYRNGLEVASQDLGTFVPDTSLDFVAGAASYEPRYFKGTLDEIALYRRALSAVEIQSVYLAGDHGRSPPEIPLNEAPVASAGPDRVLPGQTGSFSLSGRVIDDGLPVGSSLDIEWTQVSGPAVSIVSPNTLNTVVEGFGAGAYEFALSVSDSERIATDSVRIQVASASNSAPSVSAGSDAIAYLNENYGLSGVAGDDGLPVGVGLEAFWTQVSGPGRAVFADAADPATTVAFDRPGVYELRLFASDSELEHSDTVLITVYKRVNVSLRLPEPDFVYVSNGDIVLQADADSSGVPVQGVEFFVDGAPVGDVPPLPGTLTHQLTLPADSLGAGSGVFTVHAVATDGSGQTATTNEQVFYVVDPAEPTPYAEIIGPDDGLIITAPTAVVGSASSEILESYELAYRSVESEIWTAIATGTQSVETGELGVLDPTGLLNGVYEIRISATDRLARTASQTISVVVEGGMKVGNLSLAFEDLSLPVSGIPMQVIRSYDSRDLTSGDFGIGWQMAVSNVKIQKNRPEGESWDHYPTEIELPIKDENGDPVTSVGYRVESTRDNIVTLRLPDDSVAVFKAYVEPEITRFVPNRSPEIHYEALGDTLGTLEIVGQSQGWLSVTGNGLSMESEAFAFDVFNPTLYRYTAVDGTVYLIDEELGLLSITDRNGNALSIAESGISHSSGESVSFIRDSEGRVIQIVDPLGESLNYTYDALGRLETFSNQEDETFAFLYENAAHPYYLTDILDPNGDSVMSSAYDSDGRLVAQTDANGNTFGFVHDIENFQETVIDRVGVRTVHTYVLNGDIVLTEIFDTSDALVQSTAYEYDLRGNEIRVIDSLGHVTERTYDDQDNLLSETTSVTNELGVVVPVTTSYSYDAFGNPTRITDASGNETLFSYDANGNLETQTDALGNVTAFAYDLAGNLTEIVDPLGNETRFTHNSRGLAETTSTYDPNGFLVRYQSTEYDAKGRQSKVHDYDIPEGATDASDVTHYRSTEIEYDRADRQIRSNILDSESNILTSTETTYDSRGLVESQTDPLGRITRFEYDSNGNRTRSSLFTPDNSLLSSESWSYDAEGRQTAYTDPAGRVTEYDYDALGRQISVRFIGELDAAGNDLDPSDNTQTDTVYDAIGRVTATVDARGNVTLFEYDEACGCSGRRSKTIDALLNETAFRYDLNGNQVAVFDANGHETTFQYDALNRPTRTTFHDGTFTETIYDALGRRTATIDQEGNRTDFVHDSLGRLVEVLQPAPSALSPRPSTLYGYDSRGNQIEQTDAEGRVTRYEYDALGRRIKRILPEGEEETYQYDRVGNLIAKVDFAGYTTTFAYDDMNRLIEETADPTHPSLSLPHAPARIEHAYDSTGNRLNSSLFTIHSSVAYRTEAFAYDTRNRLESKTVPEGTLQYSYDAAGNLLSTTSSSSNGIDSNFSYDGLNRLQTVNDNRQPFALSLTSYTYDDVGNLDTVDYGNGVRHDYSYDFLNRLTNLVVETPNIGVHASYAYALSDSGNRNRVSETTGRITDYTYDNLYRLTSESITGDPFGGNGSVSYVYDQVGNRQTRSSTHPAIPDQTLDYTDNDRLVSDVYDSNGNTTVSADLTDDSGGNATDVYDYRNRLIRRTKADGTVIDLHYDAMGNRVGKTVTTSSSSLHTSYLIDEINHTGYSQVVEEKVGTDGPGGPLSLQTVYTYGHDLISQDRLQADPLNPGQEVMTLSFYLYDGHGTVRQLADELGTVTETYTYDAFGILLDYRTLDQSTGQFVPRTLGEGGSLNAYLYTGEQYDSDLGMYFLRARYLNPQTGRFHTKDTYEGRDSDPLTLHKYLYAHANPVMNVDPSGQFSIKELAITALIGGILNTAFTVVTKPSIVNVNERSLADIGKDLGISFAEGFATSAIGGIGGRLGLKFLAPNLRSLFLKGLVQGSSGAALSSGAKELFEVLYLGQPVNLRDRFGRVVTASIAGAVIGGFTVKVKVVKTETGSLTLPPLGRDLGRFPFSSFLIDQQILNWPGATGALGASLVQKLFADTLDDIFGLEVEPISEISR